MQLNKLINKWNNNISIFFSVFQNPSDCVWKCSYDGERNITQTAIYAKNCFFFFSCWTYVVYSKYDVRNIRISKTFTCIGIQKILETLTTLLVRVQNIYLLLDFEVFRHRERDTQFLLCWLFHLTQQRTAHHVDPTGLASPRLEKSTRFIQLQISTHCFFSKISQNSQPITSGHNVIHIPSSFPIQGFYYDICDCHILPAQAWTPALNVCPCTSTKLNGSKPN